MATYYRKLWVRSYRLKIEELEPRNAPGSILSNPALAPIFLFGIEIGDFSRDVTPAWNSVPNAAFLQLVSAQGETGTALFATALDGVFGQMAGGETPAGGGDLMLGLPAHEGTGAGATASTDSLFVMAGSVVGSDSIDRALANPLSIGPSQSPAARAGGGAGAENSPTASGGGTSAAPSVGNGGSAGATGEAGPATTGTGSPIAAAASSAASNYWELLVPAMLLSAATSSQGVAASQATAHSPPTRYGVFVGPSFDGHQAQPQLVPLAPTNGHHPQGYSLGSPPPGHGHGHGKHGAQNAANPDPLDPTITTDEDQAVNIYWLTYGDIDPNGYGLSVLSIQQPAHGSAVLNADDTVTYTPALHYSGTDSFGFTITNGQGGTNTATALITVTPVHYPPTVSDVNVSTSENSPVTITLSGSSIENLPLTYSIDAGPSDGTLGPVNINTITYYPGGDFSGTDTFTYHANDGDVSGASGTVTVTINSVTLGPGVTITPASGSLAITEQGGLSTDGSDTSDQSGTYTVVLNTQPAASVAVAVSAPSELAVDQGTLTFTPSNWSTPQTVTVTAPDDNIAQGNHTVSITHSASSSDPVYNGISIASLPVGITDSDSAGIFADPGDNPVTLNEVGPTSADNGISLDSEPLANVTVTLTPDSYETLSATSLTFTPSDWNSEQTVTVTAVNTGVAVGYHTGTVTMTAASTDPTYAGLADSFLVNILDANAPNALPVTAETDENSSTTFNVLSNDSDPNGYTLTVSSVTQPANGTVVNNGDGTLNYTPNTNWSGDDSFTYTISNGQGGSDTASVDVTADPIDLPPVVANPGDQSNPTDTPISLQISASAASASSSTAFLYSASDLPPGLVIDAETGRIWGWIDPDDAGSYDTTVTVDDQDGGVTSVEFGWSVSVNDHGPVLFKAGDIFAYVGQGGDNFWGGPKAMEIDGYPLTYTLTGLPPGITYDPTNTNDPITGVLTTPGAYSVTTTVSDGHGGTDQDTWNWYVFGTGDSAPYAYIDFGDGGPAETYTTIYPKSPITATVYLSDPSDRSTVFDVTLAVPSGMSTLSQTDFELSDGESAAFQITPAAVSQQVGDALVTVTVDGRETDRESTTNVGVVEPLNDTKGEDTPDGFENRISTGRGNWGSFADVLQVYPNLMNSFSLGLSVQSADGNSADGAAEVIDPTYMDEINSVVQICGTAQTQPALDQNGKVVAEPYELKLALAIGVGNAPLLISNHLFSVVNIPLAVKATFSGTVDATLSGEKTGPDNNWQWGVVYDIGISLDGQTARPDIWATEVIDARDAIGVMVGGAVVGDWFKVAEAEANEDLVDENTVFQPGELEYAAAITAQRLAAKIGGSETVYQYVRWTMSVEPPDGLGVDFPIIWSNYVIPERIGWLPGPLNMGFLSVHRTAEAFLEKCKAGLLSNAAGRLYLLSI